jgi:hypothetical protein
VISGFTGDGSLAGSDQIDLKDINYNSGSFTETFDAGQDTLTLQDGTNTAVLHFVGTYVNQNFSFVTDGGTGTIVYDPPVSNPPPVTAGSHTDSSGAVNIGNSDGFKFVTDGHTNLADFHPQDLPQAGGQPFPAGWGAPSQSLHDPLAGGNAFPEGHDPINPIGFANVELNLTHFHLV